MNYPYIYPGKEIEDKIPTINIDSFTTMTADRIPRHRRAHPPVDRRADVGEGPAHDEGGRRGEYSGEDGFDRST